MTYLLDTDTIIYWFKGNQNISKKISSLGFGLIASTFISRMELLYGAYKSKRVHQNLERLDLLNEKISFMNFDQQTEIIFAKTKVEQQTKGKTVDDFDLMISSLAKRYNLILVTNNTKHFKNISDLRLENWV